ncbi:MAG: hypothetical protein K8J31_25760 [Anaerolineae bacterium]|nr:hypothetical protein [Anaerolineae bacterium]
MEPELFNELTELLARWQELAQHARGRAQSHPNGTYDGYMLGLEIASDDLTRVLGKALKEHERLAADN